MSRTIRAVSVCLLLICGAAASGFAQPEEPSIEDRLIAFVQQLRLGLTLATVAAYSPTLGDLRLHTQQLVNLLEGVQGKHFARPTPSGIEPIGLLVEIGALRVRFEGPAIEAGVRERVVDATKNVRMYLTFALDAALLGLEERRIDRASMQLFRAYAFLLAAYEKPCDTGHVPALWTILRMLDLTERILPPNDSP